MEENNSEEKEARYLTPEEYLERIKQSRLLLRTEIKRFMEEETGETYQMEEDLLAAFNALSPTQQQNINGRINLLEKFSGQQ